MSLVETIKDWRFDPRNIRVLDGVTIVTTDCLYPSMSAVTVNVEGGSDTSIVHDGGRSVDEASGSGARFERPEAIIRPIAKQYGLQVDQRGFIRTSRLNSFDVGPGILMVANASRDASNALLSRYKPVVARNAKEIVHAILHSRFAEARIHKDQHILGASSKMHRIDYVIDLENGRQLMLDVVQPDASSINAAVVANIDVGKRGDDRIIQRAIYDDQRAWKSQDLALLSAVSRPVQLSSLTTTLVRLTH